LSSDALPEVGGAQLLEQTFDGTRPARATDDVEHFVTVLDGAFASRGLTLYESLSRCERPFVLWFLCVDSEAGNALDRLDLPQARLLSVDDIGFADLSVVEAQRSRKEFCWTLTPFSFLQVFSRDQSIQRVTYVDADVFILADWKPVIDELEASGKSILLTEHGFHPLWDQTERSGRFCVQFLPVQRSAIDTVITHWAAQCVDWCFDQSKNGLIGDQGYLTDWPVQYPQLVHVSENNRWFQGPWNVFMNSPSEAILFHFHGLRFTQNGQFLFGRYPITPKRWSLFYRPYMDQVCRWESHLFSPIRGRSRWVDSFWTRVSEFRTRIVGLTAHVLWFLLGKPHGGPVRKILFRAR